MAYNPLVFLDYSKITDTLMWLDNIHVLKFCVSLQKTNKQDGSVTYFHREFSYPSKDGDSTRISILRDYSFYFIIDNNSIKDLSHPDKSVMLRMRDVEFLKYAVDNSVLKWFSFGKTGAFFKSSNDELAAKGENKLVVPVQDGAKALEFRPVVVTNRYTNEQVMGVRIILNPPDHFIDLTVVEFFEFMGYMRMDLPVMAASMINYVKTKPYGINSFSIDNNRGKGFF